MDSALRANATTNQAIPAKPYLQKFGAGNILAAGLQGATAGLGAYSPGAPKSSTAGTFGATAGWATPLDPAFSPNGFM